jgi:endonuclease/exonuclease/phosphatase family metal-dependent hydrolase
MHKKTSHKSQVLRAVLGAILFSSLMAPEGRGNPSADTLKVKVMSFNILYYRYWGPREVGSWAARRRMVVDVIANSGAGVTGLQEATFPQIEYLRGKLEDELGILVTYREGLPIDKTLSNPILYRKDRFEVDDWGTFWFSDTPDEEGSKGWGNRTPRFCTWAHFIETTTGKGFYVYNAHIDHAVQNSRLRSAALIANRIAHRKHAASPVVLMGDLNAHEDNPIIGFFKGASELSIDDKTLKNPMPFVDSFRVVHGAEADAGTFHGFDKDRKRAKIDYIFVQKKTEVLDAEVVTLTVEGQYPSDHCPLTATLVFH